MSEIRQEPLENLSSSSASFSSATITNGALQPSEISTEPDLDQTIHKYEEPTPTYYDYQRQELQNTGLFKTMLTLDKGKQTVQSRELERPSILVKSFGMRNLKSLQDALKLQEQMKLQELYMRQQQNVVSQALSTVSAEEKSTSTITTRETSPGGTISTSTLYTETDLAFTNDQNRTKKHLEYLMGLESSAAAEEGTTSKVAKPQTTEEEFVFSTSKSMKTAQKYLKLHRIFDLFQFVTAHLLGACPDDPIEFILEIFNKCLLYRSRLCPPPLLYDKKHLEQMFNLMDRLGSGSIDPDNYDRAMKTMGICEYNRQPILTEEKTINKETFIHEAYDAELALFDDLIKVKCLKKVKSMMEKPEYSSRSSVFSTTSSDAQLVPSDFLINIKKQNKRKKKRNEKVGGKVSAAEEELEG